MLWGPGKVHRATGSSIGSASLIAISPRTRIASLSGFSRLIWPSTSPLLRRSIAAFSLPRDRVSRFAGNAVSPEARIGVARPPSVELVDPAAPQDPRKRIARCRMAMKLGDACFRAWTSAACAGVEMPDDGLHREAAAIGEICRPVAAVIPRNVLSPVWSA
jgi:hypothetical protein